MRGVIAAGSGPTAEAGAEVLAAGGNALDAAVAAAFAQSAGEPTVASLAAGGVMMYRDGATGQVSVLDCFADAPALRATDVPNYDFAGVDLDYGPVTQTFHVGAGSAAVPGVIPGLLEALDRWGRLPLSDVIQPACRMLRDGVTIGPAQGRMARLLQPIMTRLPETRAVFTPAGHYLTGGDTFRLPALADTLEAMAKGGGRAWYDAVLCNQMAADFGPDRGGLLTHEACAGYRVELRKPLAMTWRDHTVHLMPPPAVGGVMIGLMLALLADGPPPDVRTRAGLRRLSAAMAVADQARRDGPEALDSAHLPRWRRQFAALVDSGQPLRTPTLPGGPPSTTHISTLDADGNMCAFTFSHGESNGQFIGETGITMNNLLGEEDLHPDGFGLAPVSERLATMMSPTLVTAPDGDLLALGTGGANRIRTAILQMLVRLAAFGDDADKAVATPRMHFEGDTLSLETFDRPGGAVSATGVAEKLVPFAAPHLFFGAVNVVHRHPDGHLTGAGDPRRGGTFRAV